MDANLSHHSASSSNLDTNLLELRLDNKRLNEELENCKADKEFIWLLWKQFQKESPDLAAAVDMIMTREKLKQEEINEKASLSLQAKDEELSVLKLMIDAKEMELEDQRKRLSDVECQHCQLQKELQTQIHSSQQHAQRMSEVLTLSEELQREKDELEQLVDLKEKEFKQQLEKLKKESTQKDQLNQAKMQQLISLQQEVIDYQQQTKRLENECRAVSEKCRFLSQQLQLNNQQLAKEREQNQLKDLQMKEIREQLKVKSDHCDTWSKKIDIQSPTHDQLHVHTKYWQLKAEPTTEDESVCLEIEERDNKVDTLRPSPLPVKMTTTVKTRTGSNSSADDGGPNLVKVLKLTEKELFNCQVQLKTKSEELLGLRSSHDRRLERMQALELNYKLLLKQLKTYERESKMKSLEQTISKKDVSRRLRHENSEKVWNELSLYKSMCEDLRKQVLFLEEERDSIQTKCLRNQTTIAELRARLHHQKSDLERKLSAIACVESLSLGEPTSLSEIKELRLRVEELLEKEKQASKHNRELEKELKLRSDEVTKLQLMIIEMKKYMNVNKMKTLCQSSVTRLDILPISRADASVQTSLPMDKPEMRDAQVSPLRSVAAISRSVTATSMIHRSSHKRTYSDGDALLQQKRLQLSIKDDHFGHTFKADLSQTSSRGISGKPHKPTLEKETTSQKVPMDERECSCSCVWQRKAKTLHKQLNVASEQVSVLTMTNLSMSKSLKETRLESEKAKRELVLRGEGYKSSLKSLQREKEELQETVHEQQKSMSRLKKETTLLGKRTDADWKRLESDQKELHGRCSRLKANVKSLEESLQQKTMEVSCMQESNGRMERDVKQKRQLIEDLRTKLKEEKERSCRLEEKVKLLADEASTLSEIIEQQKRKLEVVRSQLNDQTNDKERLIEMLKNCQKELEHTIQQLQASQNLLKQQKRQNAEVELNFKIQSERLAKQYQNKLHQAECSLKEAKAVAQEFTTFTMDLARKLFFYLRKEKFSKSQHVSTDTSHISTKVRQIARDTLMLSEDELDDFFKEEPSENTALEDPRQFTNLVISTAKSKPPFASKLLKNFTDFLACS